MNYKEIFDNLNAEQLKVLLNLLVNDREGAIEFLSSEIERKENDNFDKKEDKNINDFEKNLIQIENLQKNVPDFKHFIDDLKLVFEQTNSNNDNKNLVEKLHDRLTAIVTEYIVLENYIPYLENVRENLENENDEIREDCDELKLLDFFENTHRLHNLEEQFRLLSYMYGQQLGLTDEEIINKGYILKSYSVYDLYDDISLNDVSVSEALNRVYLKNSNHPELLCVRDDNNMLTFPEINKHKHDFGFSYKYKKRDEKILYYYPFREYALEEGIDEIEPLEQFYFDVLEPYYKSIGFKHESINVIDTIPIDDNYLELNSINNEVAFYNEYEYNITQQLINEFLNQKQKSNGNRL